MNVPASYRKRAPGVTRRLERWYAECGRDFPWRRSRAGNYRLVATELLLQRTRAEVVARYYRDFFARFPGWSEASRARRRDLENAFKPLGLWKRRAQSFKALAREMARRGGVFPASRGEIESLPAVGQYVANAVELFVHGRPRPLLDVNMARIMERYFEPRRLADIRYDPLLQGLAQLLVESAEDYRVINWAFLDLGALVCKPRNPRCGECPLRRGCSRNGVDGGARGR